VRAGVRAVLGTPASCVLPKSESWPRETGLDFKDYFSQMSQFRHIPPHRVLASSWRKGKRVLVKFDGTPPQFFNASPRSVFRCYAGSADARSAPMVKRRLPSLYQRAPRYLGRGAGLLPRSNRIVITNAVAAANRRRRAARRCVSPACGVF